VIADQSKALHINSLPLLDYGRPEFWQSWPNGEMSGEVGLMGETVAIRSGWSSGKQEDRVVANSAKRGGSGNEVSQTVRKRYVEQTTFRRSERQYKFQPD
jgi:hypothetical protein